MSIKILNIIEDIKEEISDQNYKVILETLMKINSDDEKQKKEISHKDNIIKNMKNKLIRLVNRYMDMSLSFNNIILEREGLISDKFLYPDECDTGGDCFHSIII